MMIIVTILFGNEKSLQIEQILYPDFADKDGLKRGKIRLYPQNPCTKFLVGLRREPGGLGARTFEA